MSHDQMECSQTREPKLRAPTVSKVAKFRSPDASSEVFSVSHRDDWNTLLVRIGHHLWRWYKQAERNHQVSEWKVLEHALEDVWRVKREYRAPIRAKAVLVAKAASDRMREVRRAK